MKRIGPSTEPCGTPKDRRCIDVTDVLIMRVINGIMSFRYCLVRLVGIGLRLQLFIGIE